MRFRQALLAFATISLLTAGPVVAANLSIAVADTGTELEALRGQVKVFEQRTGHTVNIVPMPSSTTDQFGQYRLWLAARNTDIDVYQTDVIWAPQLASQLVDLTEATADVIDGSISRRSSSPRPSTASWSRCRLFTDAPALYYRKDLLEKYGATVPKTWDELAATAKMVMDKEREAGNKDMWGFVFQGNAYEGLTCDALEWVKSSAAARSSKPTARSRSTIRRRPRHSSMAKGWVGTISPPGRSRLQEEETRGVWQTGNAVFMRNWPYAYALGNGDDSRHQG